MTPMENINTTMATEQNNCILTDAQIKNSYDLTLHIVSIFVLLAASLIGTLFSLGSTRIKCLRVSPIIINIGKFFGTGIILATGFVHVLPSAIQTLSDPCLPDSWNVYSAYGGLFAMLAALGMQLIEFFAHEIMRTRHCSHTHAHFNDKIKHNGIKENNHNEAIHSKEVIQLEKNIIQTPSLVDSSYLDERSKTNKQEDNKIDSGESTKQMKDQKEEFKTVEHKVEAVGKANSVNSINDQDDRSIDTNSHANHIEVVGKENQNEFIVIEMRHCETKTSSVDVCEMSAHSHGTFLHDDDENNKIATYILEFGIALHSVLIGLALGTTSNAFVALFIAISFHQFFEAIALGAQIARTKKISLKSALAMVVFYSVTTPAGIAIGIGIHSGTYNPESVSSLLVTGILDSLSGGILIYVSLIDLINADMGAHATEFHSLRKRIKFLYFAALYLGATVMAIIGRWA